MEGGPNGSTVKDYVPGQMYELESDAYNGEETNCWMHVSDGVLKPVNSGTHIQASSCMMAAFSDDPVAAHAFEWTAPAVATCVTVSVAQAMDSMDNYHTTTVRRPSVSCLQL